MPDETPLQVAYYLTVDVVTSLSIMLRAAPERPVPRHVSERHLKTLMEVQEILAKEVGEE